MPQRGHPDAQPQWGQVNSNEGQQHARGHIRRDSSFGGAIDYSEVLTIAAGEEQVRAACRTAEEGLRRGATDLDMVMNIAAFKAGDYRRVAQDISDVMAVVRPFKVPFKVIIEIGILTETEKITAARLVMDSGADFVKTCTGFGPGRVTVHDIGLIKETVGDRIGIKASGGVASIEDGVALMRAGATVVAMRRILVEQLESLQWRPNTQGRSQ
jgi:deoxyribose-phosphate aldolase